MPDPFKPITLLTREGDYVTTALVPPFLTPPQVLRWGDRTFLRDDIGRYRETVAVDVVLTQDPAPEVH
ncbi:hypothetical protein [Zavarzinia aquatilis]|uniref:Uncharacterized protein n=1 Tax=Zavarzinia aquatilis TaxID=2211142 RepID=A0A317EFA2_9PROT|nr:hypothetical protein [Zavarzinia aquatilis]PWR24966.1 hypothetical protein DKG74_04140 [Zavarzinia aquatilis]